jgi:lysozyme
MGRLLNFFLLRHDGRAGTIMPMPLAARPAAPLSGKQKGGLVGLAAIVGVGVAGALLTDTPKHESGRTVSVQMDQAGRPTITHISGKQYLRVYLDLIGVATACDGITGPEIIKARREGKVFTEAECTALLEKHLIIHARIVMACSPGLALSADPAIERRREGPRFAAVSGNYNHGSYCRSTARTRFDAGNYSGGCTALAWFNRAGGRVVRGLTIRRQGEYQICVGGLKVLR